MILLGVTGGRSVGKSVLSQHLVDEHGFSRIHPFDGGKAATLAYFRHLGADEEVAFRMVFGDLKNKPSPYLPIGPDGEHFSPRYFQEKFGAFMGEVLGPAWTIDAEIGLLSEGKRELVISESIVFEIDAFRSLGGLVIKIEREGSVEGIETDRVVSKIRPDFTFQNNFKDTGSAKEAFSEFLDSVGLLKRQTPELLPGFG